jgi:hypothetical protein
MNKTSIELSTYEEEVENKLCAICWTGKKTHAMIPCGHLCVCEGCAVVLVQKRSECIICRTPVNGQLKVYS